MTEYARGASLGAPKVLQVADRWHLLANMRQAVERWLHGAHAELRRLPPVTGSKPPVPRRERAFPRSESEREAGTESRARWKAVYAEVRRRHAGGETLLGIARTLSLAHATVRKYATADAFPARLPHGPGPSLLDPHVDYLLAGWAKAARTPWRFGASSGGSLYWQARTGGERISRFRHEINRKRTSDGVDDLINVTAPSYACVQYMPSR